MNTHIAHTHTLCEKEHTDLNMARNDSSRVGFRTAFGPKTYALRQDTDWLLNVCVFACMCDECLK